MSNHRRHRRMPSRPISLVRRQAPKVGGGRGRPDAIECPFCTPTHPIYVGVPAACGTLLELEAVQATYRNVTCVLCKQSGGTLVKIHNQFVHAQPCTPGKRLYTEMPKPSRLAALVWKLPPSLHAWLARRTMRAPMELKGEGGAARGYGWQDVTFEVTLDKLNRLRQAHARQVPPAPPIEMKSSR